jgi:ketosteroid isomerase-like protein
MTPENYNRSPSNGLKPYNNKELENLLSLYDDDAEHFSPKLKPTNQKQMASAKVKQALREWWQDTFQVAELVPK